MKPNIIVLKATLKMQPFFTRTIVHFTTTPTSKLSNPRVAVQHGEWFCAKKRRWKEGF